MVANPAQILDSIMLICGSYLPLETSGLLAVDTGEIHGKLHRFGDNPRLFRIFHLPGAVS